MIYRLYNSKYILVGIGTSLPFSESQLEALHDLYDSTNGAFWIWKQPYSTYGEPWNFSVPTNPCASPILPWQGITCVTCPTNSSQLCTHLLILQSYNMSGSLPTTLNKLNTLRQLIFTSNMINGKS